MPTADDPIENPATAPADCVEASTRESQGQVVIDVLATAIVDLLLNEHSRVGGEHAATTR